MNQLPKLLIIVIFILQSAMLIAADEPQGLLLSHGDPSGKEPPRSVFIKWGTSKTEAIQELGLTCYSLSKFEGVEMCIAGYSWCADFGDATSDQYSAALYFLNGRFYSYDLKFPERAFEFTRDTINARLGEPTGQKASVVSNRMGAKFDQDHLIWKTEKTTIYLIKRQASDLTHGGMTVRYLPIANKVPSPKVGKAPF